MLFENLPTETVFTGSPTQADSDMSEGDSVSSAVTVTANAIDWITRTFGPEVSFAISSAAFGLAYRALQPIDPSAGDAHPEIMAKRPKQRELLDNFILNVQQELVRQHPERYSML
jgi:hypothetical protein